MNKLHLTIHLKDEDGEVLIVCDNYPGYSCFGKNLPEALAQLQISFPEFMLTVVAQETTNEVLRELLMADERIMDE